MLARDVPPPSFLDMIEHYMIHLVDQIFSLGLVYMHNMYAYKRHMVIMKSHVRNHAHPEGSMIEGYTTEEIIECYADYIKDGKWIGVPTPEHEGRLPGRGKMGWKTFLVQDYKIVHVAHFSVLQQLAIAKPYIEEHQIELRRENQSHTEDWVMREHRRCFT